VYGVVWPEKRLKLWVAGYSSGTSDPGSRNR